MITDAERHRRAQHKTARVELCYACAGDRTVQQLTLPRNWPTSGVSVGAVTLTAPVTTSRTSPRCAGFTMICWTGGGV